VLKKVNALIPALPVPSVSKFVKPHLTHAVEETVKMFAMHYIAEYFLDLASETQTHPQITANLKIAQTLDSISNA
jgi:hypothetical protein